MESRQLNKKAPLPSSGGDDVLCIFNGFQFSMLPCMNYSISGKDGIKTLFIVDEKETVLLCFEQGMKCLDIVFRAQDRITSFAEYREGNKYLHQQKVLAVDDRKLKDWVGFHIEITDDDGTVYVCPGQLSISPVYRQEDGVEPILIELLHSITACNTKGGGG